MGRAREAALDGAVRAVAKYGSRKATMGDIAVLAGIAKATLYNHFRTRDDVYREAVRTQVDVIAAAAAGQVEGGFAAVLAEAARLLGEHPAVRRLARDEPAVVSRLATVDGGEIWDAARAHVAAALRDATLPDAPENVDLVMRYLATQILTPSPPHDRLVHARLLHSAMESAAATVEASARPPAPAAAPRPAGSVDTST